MGGLYTARARADPSPGGGRLSVVKGVAAVVLVVKAVDAGQWELKKHNQNCIKGFAKNATTTKIPKPFSFSIVLYHIVTFLGVSRRREFENTIQKYNNKNRPWFTYPPTHHRVS
jgi:hypothetical protein